MFFSQRYYKLSKNVQASKSIIARPFKGSQWDLLVLEYLIIYSFFAIFTHFLCLNNMQTSTSFDERKTFRKIVNLFSLSLCFGKKHDSKVLNQILNCTTHSFYQERAVMLYLRQF